MALRINQADPAGAEDRWVEFDKEISFKLASLSNDNYRIAIERARRLIAREDAKQDLSTVTATAADCNEQDIQCNLLGKYIMKDWRGPIEDAKGNATDYSPESASDLLRSNSAVLVWVLQQAAKIAADHVAGVAESVGKPSSDSGGKPSGEVKAKSKA